MTCLFSDLITFISVALRLFYALKCPILNYFLTPIVLYIFKLRDSKKENGIQIIIYHQKHGLEKKINFIFFSYWFIINTYPSINLDDATF